MYKLAREIHLHSSRRVFEDLFNECLEKFFDEDADKTKIYTQGS